MIEFLNRLFGRQSSGATAKERLRLVLMSDHLSLAPEMIEAMKHDLIDVVSRYVEVDRDKIDVHFENQANALAMLANIPITGVNRTVGAGNAEPSSCHAEPAAEACHAEPAAEACHAEPVAGACHAEPVEAHAEPVEAGTEPSICHAEPVEAYTQNGKATASRKRRRKKPAAASQSGKPATAT